MLQAREVAGSGLPPVSESSMSQRTQPSVSDPKKCNPGIAQRVISNRRRKWLCSVAVAGLAYLSNPCAADAQIGPLEIYSVVEGVIAGYQKFGQIRNFVTGNTEPSTAQLIASAKDEIIAEIQDFVDADLKNSVEASIRNWAEISASLEADPGGNHSIMLARISNVLDTTQFSWVSLKNFIDTADPASPTDRERVYKLAVAFNAVTAVRLGIFDAMRRMNPPMPVADSAIDQLIIDTNQTNYKMVGYGTAFSSDPTSTSSFTVFNHTVREKVLYEKFHESPYFAASQRTCTMTCGTAIIGAGWCGFHPETHHFVGDQIDKECTFPEECTPPPHWDPDFPALIPTWFPVTLEDDDCRIKRDDAIDVAMGRDPVVMVVRAAISGALALGRSSRPAKTSYYQVDDPTYSPGAPVFLGGANRGLSLDRDPSADLLFANRWSHTVWSTTSTRAGFFGEGGGEYVWPDVFGTEPDNYFPADFNGDGIVDLGYFESRDNSFHVMTGQGTFLGGPNSGRWIEPASWHAHPSGRLFACDFSGDGLDDLGFFEPADDTFHVTVSTGVGFGGTGSGRWVSPDTFGHGSGQHYVGDFNGDGRCDLGFFEPSDDTFHVNLSTGSGFFAPGSGRWVSSNAFGNPRGRYHVGDYNGDGRDDLGFAEPGDHTFWVTLSRGDGFLGGSQWISADNFGSDKDGYFAGDYNGDGIEDLGYQEVRDNSFHVTISTGTGFAGPGSGRWIEPGQWGDSSGRYMTVRSRRGTSITSVAPDWFGLTTDPGTGQLQGWAMNGVKRVAVGSVRDLDTEQALRLSGPAWVAAGSGDFDRDGRTDILLVDRGTRELQVWLMNGLTRTRPAVSLTDRSSQGGRLAFGPTWAASVTGDFDNDGNTDVVLNNQQTGEVQIWFMDHTWRTAYDSVRAFSTGSILYAEPWWQLEAAGDMNGDRIPDLVWRDNGTGAIRIWFMAGARRQSVADVDEAGAGLLEAGSSWQIIGARDVDKDGLTDLLFRDNASGETQVWFMSDNHRIGFSSLFDLDSQEPVVVPSNLIAVAR
jgi:hypothetical protein